MSARPQTIFRTASPENPYAQIVRSMLQDAELSLEAAGALVFILSLPRSWRFDLKWLCEKRNIGRDKAQRIVRELIVRGYCVRQQMRNENGRQAAVEYVFSDDPRAISPQPENPVAVPQHLVSPQPGNPVTGSAVTGSAGNRFSRNRLSRSPENPQQRDKTLKKSKTLRNPPSPPGDSGEFDFDFEGDGDLGESPASDTPTPPESGVLTVSDHAKAQASAACPGRDVKWLLEQWREWADGLDEDVRHPDASFLAFCKRRGPMKGCAAKRDSAAPPQLPDQLRPLPGEVVIVSLGVEWGRWLAYADAKDPGFARRMRSASMAFVSSSSPHQGSPLPRLASFSSSAKKGEAA